MRKDPQKIRNKRDEKVKTYKDDYIGIQVFKKGVDAGQIIIQSVAVRSKDNDIKLEIEKKREPRKNLPARETM